MIIINRQESLCLNETFFMIFGDQTSWFLVVSREIHQNETSRVTNVVRILISVGNFGWSLSIMTFHDIWWFFVTFDDYWWFFMIKSGNLSWLIMIYHDWSWQITIQLEEVDYSAFVIIRTTQFLELLMKWYLINNVTFQFVTFLTLNLNPSVTEGIISLV